MKLLAELLGRIGVENILDALTKDFENFECERKARRIFSGFERNHGLSCDAVQIGKFGLGPIAFCAAGR